MACGEPISERIADEAAEWLTLLMSPEADDTLRQRWQSWRISDPDHERAWRHIEAVSQRLKSLQPEAGYQMLSPFGGLRRPARRRLLGLMALSLAAGGATLAIGRSQSWQTRMADYRVGTGQQREIGLSDGSRVRLNTASAIDVRFDERQRLVHLVAGEIEVSTGPKEARPFFVSTPQGRIQALGTRFHVRLDGHDSRVTVLKHAVAILPAQGGEPYVLHAGEHTSFRCDGVLAARALGAADTAWIRGQLIATDMRLVDFIAELSRYRPGLLQCDPAVAGLRLSGVFPLQDTDRILQTLPNVLPVQIRRRTGYWVSVHPRAEDA